VQGDRFDDLSRALAQASRRSVLRGFAAIAGAAVSACTPSRRPSEPSRFGQADSRLTADFGNCAPGDVKSCIAAAYNRAGSLMDDCLARCMALPEPREQDRACAACFDWVNLMVHKDARQCHAKACRGRLCMASENEPLIFACCPPKNALIALPEESWACVPQLYCGRGGVILVCTPPFLLDEEYCYCKCDDAALMVECPEGTIWDPEECRCV
jgi:hypothetical protein